MSYLDWNNRLAQYYFNEEMAGREVLLYTNRQIITSIGEGLGDVTDFINTVKAGPPWSTRSGSCQKALQACENWRRRNLDYPPYIAFLVLFVLAEDVEGDFAPHAYYPRLNQLLEGEPNSGSPPSFDKMISLWDDLEKWSKEDKHEELGRFTARIRGGWIHVGLPLSQTILSREERNNLPYIFSEADLDPTDPPPVDILKQMLQHHGRRMHLLGRRTLRLLESANNVESTPLKNALLEFVLEELSGWDQTVPDARTGETSIVREAKTGLRICLHEDKLSRRVNTYLRFKTNRVIPDTGLNFVNAESGQILTCFETNANWSSQLRDKDTSKAFDASSISWDKELHIKDIDLNWCATLKAANVRLFYPGKKEELPDWIESHHLERQGEFLIAANSSVKDTIRNWGTQFCEDFQEKDYLGLPERWTLFYGKNATRSCGNIDILTLSYLLRIRLLGGIKTGRGNGYFKFGLPSVMLENMSGSEKVKINGLEIPRADQNIPVWEIKGDFRPYEPLRIEVFGDNNEILQTRIIRIEEPSIQSSDDLPKRGPDGGLIYIDSPAPYVIGAIVSEDNKKEGEVFSIPLPTHLSSRIIFLGSNHGEIKDWPGEELPLEWYPVWVLAKEGGHKQWAVHFCGKPEHLREKHIRGKPLSDKKAVRRWKEAVWFNRKICQPPALPHLARMWKKFVETARNA